ncbi:Pentatricopeptide repeat-containing protein (Partial), partial [Seminavis robusta]|eukprot:Sro1407_g270040.1 Pentatricopeptide repeat-containing protein (410) ;mRNA; f:28712-29942
MLKQKRRMTTSASAVTPKEEPRIGKDPKVPNNKILQIPIGSLSPEQWQAAVTTQESPTTHSSFPLLGRLVQEYQLNPQFAGSQKHLTELQTMLRHVSLSWEQKWANQSRQTSSSSLWTPDKVLSFLQDCERDLPELSPDLRTYNAIMNGWLAQTTISITTNNLAPQQCVKRVEQLMPFLWERFPQQLDTRTYEIIIQIYSRAGCFQQICNVLDQILQLHNSNKNKKKTPVPLRFQQPVFDQTLMDCVNGGHRHAGFTAETILEKLNHMYHAGLLGFRPHAATSYTMAIMAWAKSGHPEAGNRAMAILDELTRRSASDPIMTPSAHTYSAALHAWARLGNANQADALLDRMFQVYYDNNKNKNHNNKKKAIKPELISFNNVLDAYAKSGLKDAGIRSERRLRQMWDLHDQG